MNLLNRLTIKNLELNKKRTIVTIIGIILATALITAITGMASSFRATMIKRAKTKEGDFHYAFCDVPKEDLKYIENNRNIESYYITQNIGYASLEESKNEYKPYLYLMAYNGMAFEKSSIKLLEGRMPKNDSEIILSEHIMKNGKVFYKIGDKLTIDVSKRLVDEYELSQENGYVKGEENLKKEYTKTYEIVGIIERPNMSIEPHSAPGFSIITYLNTNKINDKSDIYVRYTKEGLKNKAQVTSNILGISSDIIEKAEMPGLTNEDLQELQKSKYEYKTNESLLQYEILNVSSSNLNVIYTVSIIVTAIIIFTSVFCIRNSFDISITEKMRQYGMLSSIGATSKQIKKNVFYEALIISIIGIPLGILSGMFAVFVLLKIISKILESYLNGLEFVFKISSISIIFAIILAMLTIFLSARRSAKRAAKVSPMEAIRSNEDIKIKSKKLKSLKIIKRFFGIGGDIAYKNLKRNRKKYRTTLISIVGSVSIFISMSTFMTYAFKSSSIYYDKQNYNLLIYGENPAKEYEKVKEISNMEDVDKVSIIRYILLRVNKNELKMTEKAQKSLDRTEAEDNNFINIDIISLGNKEYERYIKELGLNKKLIKDKGILINNVIKYEADENGKSKYQSIDIYNCKVGEKINATLLNDRGEEIKKEQLEIAKVTDKKPMGLENRHSDTGYLVINDEWIDKNNSCIEKRMQVYIQANDPYKVEEKLKTNYGEMQIINYDSSAREENALYLVIAIFLYGFITVISLIGITNIFNIITTNMNLRSKEFANLKSIGMTQKEFNRMISLESIFYGAKSLAIGVPIGIALSYVIYRAFGEGMEFGFLFPTSGVIIAIIAVFVLITGIMRYSLIKINKQNIIETIRKDNI